MSPRAYIALGTNLGDRWVNLQVAKSGFAPKIDWIASSLVYETPPWGIVDQPAFLNQVALVETDLSPVELLAYLKEIESRMGRQPSERYGPRLIDMDILFYDDLVLDLPGLKIPHPQLEKRAFVLLPLTDLAPDLRHPVSGKSVADLLEAVDVEGISVYEPGEAVSGR